ncbi:MAG TPA: hypothetical protein VII69_10825 [Candidatus Eremiobacteraceae bacterium]
MSPGGETGLDILQRVHEIFARQVVARAVGQSARVVEQVAAGERPVLRVDAKVRQVVGDGFFGIERTAIPRLQQRHGGHGLRDRTHAEERRRGDGPPGLEIGRTEIERDERPVAVGDRKSHSWNMVIVHECLSRGLDVARRIFGAGGDRCHQ